ncbi:MAG: hypothetical protein JHC74_03715 [Thermoleophilia bacterium]|nr:hypothetical protein [Thermoleophilia bacterium]
MRAGLCGACAHQRLVPATRATYSMCRLAADDPRFPRYPPLPVIRCAGFTPAPAAGRGPRAVQR